MKIKTEQKSVIYITEEEYEVIDCARDITTDLGDLAYYMGDESLEKLAWEISHKLDDLAEMIIEKCKFVD